MMQQAIDHFSLHAEIGLLPIALTIVCSFLFLKSIYENEEMGLINVFRLMAIFELFISVIFSKVAQYSTIRYAGSVLAPLISSTLVALSVRVMYLLSYSVDNKLYKSSAKKSVDELKYAIIYNALIITLITVCSWLALAFWAPCNILKCVFYENLVGSKSSYFSFYYLLCSVLQFFYLLIIFGFIQIHRIKSSLAKGNGADR